MDIDNGQKRMQNGGTELEVVKPATDANERANNHGDDYCEQDAWGKAKGSAANAFRRVKAEDWLGQKGAWDNSYVGTFGKDGWGYKAQEVLGQVRGKDFRHEKTKKKRGAYKGGLINSNVINSYKFDSDED